MEATKEETAAAVEKMKSEFAHVHDYLDGRTETSPTTSGPDIKRANVMRGRARMTATTATARTPS